ncbi:hypothetical protein [Chryseolinea lacunae]|uniref:Protein kinase domain-containing protein n=1 Tax=Chryseolinea lacunae TaxID=2801331 RepID=A0ABS1KUV8_9BACT|nr:hypothetical protein [Chryseolinea lacunae]MBL0742978.1 hypothetical protein [Chryseolinea lacunae]
MYREGQRQIRATLEGRDSHKKNNAEALAGFTVMNMLPSETFLPNKFYNGGSGGQAVLMSFHSNTEKPTERLLVVKKLVVAPDSSKSDL